jgi:hypothetical protein
MKKTKIEINGETKTLDEWCKIYGTNQSAVRARIFRGWNKEKAISTPTIPKSPIEDKLIECVNCKKQFMSRYRKGKNRNKYEECCSWSCAQAARSTKHGQARKKGNTTPEYHAWEAIKERCINKNTKSYKDYGARGISMNKEWIDSFQKFFDHVGNRPTPKHQIDRINNDGNYEPGNVKWSTKREQMNNRRNTIKLTVNGETKAATEWAEIYKIDYQCLVSRIKRGMEPLAALTEGNKKYKNITINGETKPLYEWLKIYKNNYWTVRGRIQRGWDEIKAITTPPKKH